MGAEHGIDSAATMILVGLILQGVEVAVLLGIGLFLLAFSVVGAAAIALAIVGVVWTLLVGLFSYAPTARGDARNARTPTLVFAIVSLVTLNVLSGILYILAYEKLDNAVEAVEHPLVFPVTWGTPSVAPTLGTFPGVKYCPRCGTGARSMDMYCGRCGGPLPV